MDRVTPSRFQSMLRQAGIESRYSRERDTLRGAARCILPCVGHFRFGIESLKRFGLVGVLDEQVVEAHVPILGICLGGQRFCRKARGGDSPGLKSGPMETVRFDPARMKKVEKVSPMG